jgi:transcriptional regulator with XRE-family HTH domain
MQEMAEKCEGKRSPRGEVLPHLEAWRRRKALTQAEVAKAARIVRGTVARAEAGEVIQYSTIRAIAAGLGITVDQLRQEPPAQDDSTHYQGAA